MKKMNPPHLDWEPEEMFGPQNSTAWAIEDLTQGMKNHRNTMILDKVYKAFFHYKDFINWAY